MNVILIIFDSLRKDCIGCFGSPPWGEVYTPNLNEFSKESFVLGNCFPESLPTLQARRAIYTGQRVYPFEGENRKRKGDFYGMPGWGPISENKVTLSELLQENGYTTALISDISHQFKPSKNFHRGFDEWIWVRGYEMDHYRSGHVKTKEEINYWLPIELQTEKIVKFMNQCLMNMDEVKKEEDYSVARVMREAARWLEQNQDKDKKFLMIESWSPHEPWFIPEHYRKMYCDLDYPMQVLSLYRDVSNVSPEIIKSTQANYSGLVTMCDRWFGYLYDCVANLGLLDDTLIIVTTDHGHSIGDNNYLGKRGYPSSPEVYHIPILLRHPDNSYGRGIKNNMLVQHTDITATILDIVGIKKIFETDSYKWDDLWSILMEPENKREIKNEIKLHGRSFFDKLISNKNSFREHVTVAWGPNITVITDNWWFNCRVNGNGAFLFDLSKDEPFKDNVANAKIDIVKELFSIAKQDANGKFPDYLVKMANNEIDAPGCSDLALQ